MDERIVDEAAPSHALYHTVSCHYLDENTDSICLNLTNDTKLDGTKTNG
jgi:hypothetical protein